MEKKKLLGKLGPKAGKVLNVCWKLAVVAIGAFAVLLISILVEKYQDEHCGEWAHHFDVTLSENISVHRFRANIVRVYDHGIEEYVTPRLRWVAQAPERDSLTVFCDKNGKRGFLNVNTGKIVIGGKYAHAWVFSDGLAAVVEPDGKMGFIDRTGEYVIAPKFDYKLSHDYVFRHDLCCIADHDGKQGLIARDGEWILPQEYSSIEYVAEADMFIPAMDGKCGLVRNGSCEWVYPLEYDDIHWTDAPAGKGFILYRDYQAVHVAVDGSVITPFVVDETAAMKYKTKFHSDVADEYEISDKVIAFEVCDLWGVMDKHTGKVLIPAMYGSVYMASEDILQCELERYGYGEYALYDLNGNILKVQ